jgi:hypothetical protein
MSAEEASKKHRRGLSAGAGTQKAVSKRQASELKMFMRPTKNSMEVRPINLEVKSNNNQSENPLWRMSMDTITPRQSQ